MEELDELWGGDPADIFEEIAPAPERVVELPHADRPRLTKEQLDSIPADQLVKSLTREEIAEYEAALEREVEPLPAPRPPSQEELERGVKATALAKRVIEFPPFNVVRLSVQAMRDPRWVWYPRVPRALLTVIDGHPASGKSTLLVDVVARISNHRPFPDESQEQMLEHRQGKERVLWVTVEDSPLETITPRLVAAGADLDYVQVLPHVPLLQSRTDNIRTAEARERVLTTMAVGRYQHLVIDPGNAVLEEGNAETAVRSVMTWLFEQGQANDFTSYWIRHLTKASATGDGFDPMMSGMGSVATVAGARSVMMVQAIREEGLPLHQWKRVLHHTKCNLGPQADSLLWRFDWASIEGLRSHHQFAVWEGVTDRDPREIAATNKKSTQFQSRDDVRDALDAAFESGPMSPEQIMQLLAALGARQCKKGPSDWKGWSEYVKTRDLVQDDRKRWTRREDA